MQNDFNDTMVEIRLGLAGHGLHGKGQRAIFVFDKPPPRPLPRQEVVIINYLHQAQGVEVRVSVDQVRGQSIVKNLCFSKNLKSNNLCSTFRRTKIMQYRKVDLRIIFVKELS